MLIGIAMKQSAKDRHPEDVQIEPGGPVRDVVKVVLDALAERSVAAPAVDLGPAGDAGLDAVASHVVRNGLAELVDEEGALRPGADQAHVALQDVDELGQLVQTGAAQEGTDGRAAR